MKQIEPPKSKDSKQKHGYTKVKEDYFFNSVNNTTRLCGYAQ